ncbi:putative Peptide transporter PTR1 [Cocos nucifera]|uniref:Putative Peptide transporter PTR1 n=1 Tax=Cocos nucifera TaxID=13894 RepID=A0A8K0HZL4_COCNU|nr:putative Peptide transporter PTR1 [Cocos nucifera]
MEAFGADQFDSRDPSESQARSSFFNWWFFGAYTGILVAAHVVLNYVQDYVGWALCFGFQCTAMGLALVVFLAGTKTYCYHVVGDKTPFMRIAEMPYGLRSLGVALYLSVYGIGSFLSGSLISMIDSFTAARGEGWFNNNLNLAHLDYFFWLLAGLCIAGFAIYLPLAKSYYHKI